MKNKLHETFHMNYHHMIITWLMNDKREKNWWMIEWLEYKNGRNWIFLLRFAKVKVRLLLGGCCLLRKNKYVIEVMMTYYIQRDLQNWNWRLILCPAGAIFDCGSTHICLCHRDYICSLSGRHDLLMGVDHKWTH